MEVYNPWPLIVVLLGLGALALTAISMLTQRKWFATVPENSRGLVYQHGKFEKDVGPGRHWLLHGRSVLLVAVNEQIIAVSGQEVMTSDRLAVRLSALAKFKIVDARLAQEKSNGGYYQPVYYAVQIAMREVVAARTLEELLDTRGVVKLAGGDIDGALIDLQEAVDSSNPPSAVKFFHLAWAQHAKHLDAEAAKSFEEAQKLGLNAKTISALERPKFDELRTALPQTQAAAP